MNRFVVYAPLVIGLLAATLLWRQQSTPETAAKAVDIPGTQQSFDTLPELLDNTTIAVSGTVDRVEVGQTYTDPNKPDAGFISQFANVRVDATLYGPSSSDVIVEQEATLLDGTPITIDGTSPLVEGERVVLFLVQGTTSQNRHFGIVGTQGRYEVDVDSGSSVLRVVGLSPDSSTPSFDGLEIEEVKRRIQLQ